MRENFLRVNDLSQINNHYKKARNISSSHYHIIKRISKEIEQSIEKERKIMYSDIINLIMRKNYTGKMYNEIIIWCNYKIKQGKYFLLIDQIKF